MFSLGLWGCGWMGEKLAEAAVRTGLAHVRMVYDLDEARSKALASRTGAQAAISPDSLLNDSQVMAVMIALPSHLHRPAVEAAAQAGKHIFLEKPMAFTLEDCRAMNAAARSAGVSLMVGHVLRYYEPFRSLTRWAKEGRFGELLHAEIWRLESEWVKIAPWKGKRETSGGYLYELGAHDLDWLRMMLGEPSCVYALVLKSTPSLHEIEDCVSVQLGFSSGATAHYLGGAGFPKEEYGFRLYFRRAIISSPAAFDLRALQIEWAAGEAEKPLEFPVRGEDPVEAELRDWLDCLSLSRSVPITGEDATRTIAIVEAAYRSSRLGVISQPEIP